MVILSRGTARGSWRIGGRRGIRKREEKRAGGVGSKMVESGRNRGKLKGFNFGSQEKRGRSRSARYRGREAWTPLSTHYLRAIYLSYSYSPSSKFPQNPKPLRFIKILSKSTVVKGI